MDKMKNSNCSENVRFKNWSEDKLNGNEYILSAHSEKQISEVSFMEHA